MQGKAIGLIRIKKDQKNKINSVSFKRKSVEILIKSLMYFCVLIIVGILLSIIGYIVYRGSKNITWELLTTSESLLEDKIGILPNILNTIYIIIISISIVLPLGVGSAIYLNEYAKNQRLVKVIQLAIQTLAAIPSIIYALVGLLIFVQFFSLGTSIISGALTLVIMTFPTIISTTLESLKTVPDGYRQGSLALGAKKWYMIKTVVLPSSIDGIVTGSILAVGRIVGESAALLFTCGMANKLMGFFQSLLPGSSGSTLTVALYMYAKERGEFDIAFAIATILLIITFVVNISAKILGKVLKRRSIK